MTRINRFDAAALRLGFVADEGSQLGKRPAVEPSLLLTSATLHAVVNVREVFQHNRSADENAIDNTAGKNVVTIPAEACLSAPEDSQSASGRFCSFGLALPPLLKDAGFNFLPAILPQEQRIGRDGGASDSKIDTNYHV